MKREYYCQYTAKGKLAGGRDQNKMKVYMVGFNFVKDVLFCTSISRNVTSHQPCLLFLVVVSYYVVK